MTKEQMQFIAGKLPKLIRVKHELAYPSCASAHELTNVKFYMITGSAVLREVLDTEWDYLVRMVIKSMSYADRVDVAARFKITAQSSLGAMLDCMKAEPEEITDILMASEK